MNPTSLKAAICINLAAILSLVSPAAHAGVVYIDKLTTLQTNAATDNSSTNTTIVSTNAVGGFRTLELSSTNNDVNFVTSQLRVLTNTSAPFTYGPRLVLSSGNSATANFTVTWGGTNGTNGLGGIDFRDGIPAIDFSLVKSTLNFSLLESTLVSNSITWTFTDTSLNTATHTEVLPVKPAYNSVTSPAQAYAISLNSFIGAGSINWSSINFITLSGGGIASLDMSLGGAFSVTATTIPEPGTWAAAGLLVLTAFYIRRRRMRATTEEAPAAA